MREHELVAQHSKAFLKDATVERSYYFEREAGCRIRRQDRRQNKDRFLSWLPEQSFRIENRGCGECGKGSEEISAIH